MTQGALQDIELPANWVWEPLGYLAPRVANAGRGDLEPLSVYLGAGVVRRADREDNHNVLGADMDKYLHVQPGDLVFNKLRTWQGGLGASNYEGIVSPAYYVLRTGPRLDPRFANYVLLSSPYLAELTRLSKFMPPSQFDMPWEALMRLPMLVPPIEEQRRIADFLDDQVGRIDQAIEMRRGQISALTGRLRYQQGEIFSGGSFPPSQDRSRRLAGCLLANDGGVWGEDPTGSGDTLVLRSTEISVVGKWRNLEEAALRTLSTAEAVANRVREGDIIVTKASGSPDHIGKSGLVTAEVEELGACFGNFMQRLRTNPSLLLPGYLHGYLMSDHARAQFQYLGTTSTGLMNISATILNDLRVVVPSLEAQQRAILKWNDLDLQATAAGESLREGVDLLEERKRSLITAAVTGQLDVTVANPINVGAWVPKAGLDVPVASAPAASMGGI